MNRIRLLPEQVANQIAAGEVVERPASVVKELVENSLDARAGRISVEIQAGGRSLIRVTDDGLGMSRDDALLCLERHATSKIQRAEDLASIGTMGFRGEALPSIASVSRFTLTTRERDDSSPEGTQIIIAAGKILEVKAAGSAPGTSVEVRQLFYNLPARRKFLRTEETESAHIQHYLTLAALAFPQIAFTFQKDGRVVWQLAAVREPSPPAAPAEMAPKLLALRERLNAVYGGEQKLLAVDFLGELSSSSAYDESAVSAEEDVRSEKNQTPNASSRQFRVWGFIGAPGVSRATREDQHIFVNRRPIENRGLNFALLEGYHTALMKGRYPVCCLFVEMDPAAVDVNIHPAKREVKFHREMEVRKLMAQAIRERLLQFHGGGAAALAVSPPRQTAPADPSPEPVPQQTGFATFPSHLQPAAPSRNSAPRQGGLPMGFSQPEARSVSTTVKTPGQIQNAVPESPAVTPLKPLPPAPLPDSQTASAPEPSSLSRTAASPASSGPVPLLQVPLRLVGVIGKLYVVLESDRGLVLLDQHAAHERILFEQMLNRLEQNAQAPSQRLLLPATVELSARDAQFLREHLQTLTRLGVGLSEFGERTFLLDALPPFVRAPDARQFVVQLVDELKAAGQQVNSLRLGEHMVAKTVCRHAVKANDPLAGRELENLVEDLRHCAMPYTCPHGRPTLIEMNFRELEKKFGRSQ